jgi:thioredoxin 1
MIRSIYLVLTCVFAGMAFASAARPGDEPPPVFDKRPYAEAKKAAGAGKKWFIVKATAVWCGPCKQMDKTTWRDKKVVEWVKKNAILVALDVDDEKKLAEELGIEAMPTMIAFKEGDKEFDRVVGYKAPEVMLGWLEGIAKGEKSIEAAKKHAAAPVGKGVDVRAKMDLARSLTDERKYNEAADEFVWLWKNMLQHQKSMYGVRLSFMAGDMQRLAMKSKEAKGRFIALRDETGKRLENEKVDMDDVVDWVVLNNRVLEDTDATLKWFDRVKDQPKWQPLIQRVGYELTNMFVELHRWADVGRLSADPLGDLEMDWEIVKISSGQEIPKGMPEDQRKMMEETPKRMFREKAGTRYAGLLAAGRDELASRLAAAAMKNDSSAEMIKALVGTAMEAKQPRAVQEEWMAANKDESMKGLRERVDEALKKTK